MIKRVVILLLIAGSAWAIDRNMLLLMAARQQRSAETINDVIPDGWWDATATYVQQTGQYVSNWLDRSGNAYHGAQAVTTNQPTGGTGINGHAALFFTNDFLSMGAVHQAPASNQTIIVVATPYGPQPSANRGTWIGNWYSAGGYGFYLALNSVGLVINDMILTNGTEILGRIMTQSTTNATQMFTVRMRGSDGYMHGYLNGALDTVRTNTSNVRQFKFLGTNDNLWTIGMLLGVSGSSYNGELQELRYYRDALTDTQLGLVHSNLIIKWSITP